MWAGRVKGGIHREMGPALDVKAEQIGVEISMNKGSEETGLIPASI